MMVESWRGQDYLEVTDDAEWSVLQPLLLKLIQAKQDLNAFSSNMGMGGFGGGRGGRGGGMGGGMGGGGGPGGFGGGGGRGGMAMMGMTNTVPEMDSLQKVIDSNGSKAEMKAALDKFYAARKVKEAAYQQAQEAVRKLLTPRQEAILALLGYL